MLPGLRDLGLEGNADVGHYEHSAATEGLESPTSTHRRESYYVHSNMGSPTAETRLLFSPSLAVSRYDYRNIPPKTTSSPQQRLSSEASSRMPSPPQGRQYFVTAQQQYDQQRQHRPVEQWWNDNDAPWSSVTTRGGQAQSVRHRSFQSDGSPPPANSIPFNNDSSKPNDTRSGYYDNHVDASPHSTGITSTRGEYQFRPQPRPPESPFALESPGGPRDTSLPGLDHGSSERFPNSSTGEGWQRLTSSGNTIRGTGNDCSPTKWASSPHGESKSTFNWDSVQGNTAASTGTPSTNYQSTDTGENETTDLSVWKKLPPNYPGSLLNLENRGESTPDILGSPMDDYHEFSPPMMVRASLASSTASSETTTRMSDSGSVRAKRTSNSMPKKEYRCTKMEGCEARFSCNSLRKKHEMKHTKPFICPHRSCPKHRVGFTTSNDLRRHLKALHGHRNPSISKSVVSSSSQGTTVEVGGWRCKYCPQESPAVIGPVAKSFFSTRKDNFRNHVKRIHSRLKRENESMDDFFKRTEIECRVDSPILQPTVPPPETYMDTDMENAPETDYSPGGHRYHRFGSTGSRPESLPKSPEIGNRGWTGLPPSIARSQLTASANSRTRDIDLMLDDSGIRYLRQSTGGSTDHGRQNAQPHDESRTSSISTRSDSNGQSFQPSASHEPRRTGQHHISSAISNQWTLPDAQIHIGIHKSSQVARTDTNPYVAHPGSTPNRRISAWTPVNITTPPPKGPQMNSRIAAGARPTEYQPNSANSQIANHVHAAAGRMELADGFADSHIRVPASRHAGNNMSGREEGTIISVDATQNLTAAEEEQLRLLLEEEKRIQMRLAEISASKNRLLGGMHRPHAANHLPADSNHSQPEDIEMIDDQLQVQPERNSKADHRPILSGRVALAHLLNPQSHEEDCSAIGLAQPTSMKKAPGKSHEDLFFTPSSDPPSVIPPHAQRPSTKKNATFPSASAAAPTASPPRGIESSGGRTTQVTPESGPVQKKSMSYTSRSGRSSAQNPNGRVQDQSREYKELCPKCPSSFRLPCQLSLGAGSAPTSPQEHGPHRKHMKRHSKPFGCTHDGCSKVFGAKNDWKRHENSQHHQLECWKCDINLPKPDDQTGTGTAEGAEYTTSDHTPAICGKCFFRKADFVKHLKDAHGNCDGWLIEPAAVRNPDGSTAPASPGATPTLKHVPNSNGVIRDATQIQKDCHIPKYHGGAFWCGFCHRVIKLDGKVGIEGWDKRFDHIARHFEKEGLRVKDSWMRLGDAEETLDKTKKTDKPAEDQSSDDDPDEEMEDLSSPSHQTKSAPKPTMWYCCQCKYGPYKHALYVECPTCNNHHFCDTCKQR